MNKIRISDEPFQTVQGEGMFSGVPSLFIRTSGCSLRCAWCDTAYASWQPEGPWVDIAQLVMQVQQASVPHVVITGGEPMMFPEQVAAIIEAAHLCGKVVTVETAGIIWDERVKPDLFSVSPKLSNSFPKPGSPKALELHQDNLTEEHLSKFNYWPYTSDNDERKVQFKFVVTSEQDLLEVRALQEMHKLNPHTIWLMPEGIDERTIIERGRWLAPLCIKHGYNLAMRMHVILWGHRRGV